MGRPLTGFNALTGFNGVTNSAETARGAVQRVCGVAGCSIQSASPVT